MGTPPVVVADQPRSTGTDARAPTFGQRVRAIMEEKGLSQTALAQKTGIERSEINRTLNDKRNPRPDEISWIATALGIEPRALLEGVEMPANLQRAIEQAEIAAKRVLQAEGERDEAREQLRALQQSIAEERAGWNHDRSALEDAHQRERRMLTARIAALEAALRESRAELEQGRERHAAAMSALDLKVSEEIAGVRAEAAQREAALRAQLNSAQQAANVTAARLAMSEARNRAQATQIEQLQKTAASLQEDSNKEGGRLLITGLLGSFLGVALGAAASSGDDDEE